MDNLPTHFNAKKRAMIQALERSLGVVAVAAKAVGIDRTTHYVWIKDDPDYAIAVANLKELALDFAESKLHKRIEAEDTTAIIYYLNHQGRGRGYNAVPNGIQINTDGNTQINFNFRNADS